MAPSPTAPEKLLVFGMDSADWRVLQPLIDAGRVPTLARVLREGAHGDLQSTIHPHSPTAWSTFLTGMNPGQHGIFDFMELKPGSYEYTVVKTRSRGGRAIWQTLSEKGIACGIVNVPMTFPPEKVRGFFISGAFSSDPFGDFSWPKSLLEDVKARLGHGYRVDVHLREIEEKAGAEGEAQVMQEFLDELIQVEVERTEATLLGIEKHAPRFVVHVHTATDRAQHTFWQYLDRSRSDHDPAHMFAGAVDQTYINADQQLARLWDAMGEDTTVMVMSDHGGGSLRRVLLLNTWLEAGGYLTTEQPAPLSRKAIARAVFRQVVGVARKLLPTSVKIQLKGRFDVGGQTTLKLAPRSTPDWARTKAFSEGTFGNIRLNVRGRDPLGSVEPGDEYERLRAEIKHKLETLVDPGTGETAVHKVWMREELYHGAHIAKGPDIVVELKDGYQMVADIIDMMYGNKKEQTKAVFASGEGNRFKLSGIHGPVGILLARGPGIEPGATITGAHIGDLAPTILVRFGLVPTAGMDGTPLDALLGARHPVAR